MARGAKKRAKAKAKRKAAKSTKSTIPATPVKSRAKAPEGKKTTKAPANKPRAKRPSQSPPVPSAASPVQPRDLSDAIPQLIAFDSTSERRTLTARERAMRSLPVVEILDDPH